MNYHRTINKRGLVRLSALSALITNHTANLEKYRGDIVYASAKLALNDFPCIVGIRREGFEIAFDQSTAQMYLRSFASTQNYPTYWFTGSSVWSKSHPSGECWYPGDPLEYKYEFQPVNELQASNHLAGSVLRPPGPDNTITVYLDGDDLTNAPECARELDIHRARQALLDMT